MATQISTDVLVAGAGPCGLMLANELGRRGVRALVVDARAGTAHNPQANATQARTMEHYRRLGFADEVRAVVIDSVSRTGEVGMMAGFTIYTSNNLVLDTTRKYMYGTTAAITFAEQVISTEALRGATAFADQLRGRLVYGRKVVRPSALGVISATE
jgi:2-polyprenyl-6-methoxyphenol hydroxylase-like FAD-dependent oxidoreductase